MGWKVYYWKIEHIRSLKKGKKIFEKFNPKKRVDLVWKKVIATKRYDNIFTTIFEIITNNDMFLFFGPFLSYL